MGVTDIESRFAILFVLAERLTIVTRSRHHRDDSLSLESVRTYTRTDLFDFVPDDSSRSKSGRVTRRAAYPSSLFAPVDLLPPSPRRDGAATRPRCAPNGD